MEAALRSVLKDTLGEYVKRGLERADTSSFPLVLRDLLLNEKKVQQEFDEDGTSPITLTAGKIGSIKVTPSWMGTVEVLATNIELSFAFSATKAMANAMKGNDNNGYEAYEAEELAPQAPAAPPPPCPPRFCCNHDSSEKRVKGEPVSRECKSCGIAVQSSYKDFQLCPPCSDKEQRCLICGAHAPKAATYIPQGQVGTQGAQNQGMPQSERQSRPGGNQVGSHSCQNQGMPQSERQSRPGGNQAGNLPPPPPPHALSHRAGNGNGYGEPGRHQRGDSFLPDTARSMQLSQYQSRPAPDYSTHVNPENFSTLLPQNHRLAVPPGGPPMGQNRRPMTRPRQGQMTNDDDDSFGGFLRYVATDVWGMCAHPNQRLDSFGGPTPAFGQQGFKRGGA